MPGFGAAPPATGRHFFPSVLGPILCKFVVIIRGGMRLSALLEILRALAPEGLAEPWDRVGLQVGDLGQSVRKAVLCIDLTETVLREAIEGHAELVVAYHPPIFEPLTHLRSDTWKGRMLVEATRCGVAIYTPHTALDAATGGVNDWLASQVGEGRVTPIRKASPDQTWVKISTFVPRELVDHLRETMAAAGAGALGHYTHCSFTAAGEGTFQGDDRANPTVGRPGRLERVSEGRLEMLCQRSRARDVVAALRAEHPYEEPAIDVFAQDELALPAGSPPGQGRIVTLAKPISLARMATRVRDHLHVKTLRVAAPTRPVRIARIGTCPGAGGALLAEAEAVDAYLTGEMRYHDVLDATQRGVAILLAGHAETERPYLKVYRRRLQRACPEVRWWTSRADRAAIKVM